MKQWRTIIHDINHALRHYECTVSYHPPSGSGWHSCCSYFEILIADDFDCETVDGELHGVSKAWDLTIDWYNTNATVDLNAEWDIAPL